MISTVVGGILLAAVIAAVWHLWRPLRERPRPAVEVSAARYQRLAPVVAGLLVTLGAVLLGGLLLAAVF